MDILQHILKFKLVARKNHLQLLGLECRLNPKECCAL